LLRCARLVPEVGTRASSSPAIQLPPQSLGSAARRRPGTAFAGPVLRLAGGPLVGDLELVRIPSVDPPWSSSPLIRGPLVLYSIVLRRRFGLDTQRRLEDSRAVLRTAGVPAMRAWGLPDIHLAAVCLAQCSLRYVGRLRDGGDEETRTPDPLLAKEMLFQLSYVPVRLALREGGGRTWTRTRDLGLIRAAL
jgi:hypothetical protein